MNNADLQILRAIQKGPSGAALVALAGIVEQLGQELDAVREQMRQLASRPDPRGLLGAPAVAYDPEDPNTPKAGGV